MAAVQLDNIAVRIMGRWVLSGLEAEVPLGQQVLLTGANGAGKTTLLRLIATALRPHAGRLSLFGQSSPGALRAARKRLGLMTHQHYFYEPLSAAQNLRLIGQLSGHNDVTEHNSLLQQVNLWSHRDRPVASYSAGMKRRLALARLTLLRPDLVLLDEPFGQLDPDGVQLMHQAIRAMAARGATIIVATHDIDRGEALCTLRWHLTPGRPGITFSALGAKS